MPPLSRLATEGHVVRVGGPAPSGHRGSKGRLLLGPLESFVVARFERRRRGVCAAVGHRKDGDIYIYLLKGDIYIDIRYI